MTPTTNEIRKTWCFHKDDKPDKRWSRYPDSCIALLCDRVDELEAIIAKHELCHDLHGKVGRDEFEEGCRRETIKEFGSCGWAERIAELEALVAAQVEVIAAVREQTEAMREIIERIDRNGND